MTPSATAPAVSPHGSAPLSRVVITRYAAVFALLAATVALVGLAHPASASAAGQPQASPMVPTVPVMIVLDASGSMNESDAPGPRLDAAKRAVKNLVGSLPSTTMVGLIVYGTGSGSAAADKTPSGSRSTPWPAPSSPASPPPPKAPTATPPTPTS